MLTLLQKIRRRGLVNLLEIQFNRIVPVWLFRFSMGDVFELDVDSLRQIADQSANDGLVYQVVMDCDDRQRLRERTWNSVPIETTQNDYGFAVGPADSPTEFQGGVWGGVESFIESNLGFRLLFDADQAWIYCAYIDPSVRGKGAYQRLLAFAVKHLDQQGYHRIYVVVQPWNKASIHVHRKFSQRRVGRITVVRILRWASVFGSGYLTKDRTWTTEPENNPVLFKIS